MSSIQMLPRVLPNLGEKAIGLTKEVLGTVLDRERLREQGQAQQEKATQRLEQFQRELRADARRAEAQAREGKQMAHQGSESRGGTSEMAKTGPEAAASATGEKVKGGLKEAVGSVIGNDDMRREGAAQQGKAAKEREVASEEAKAEESRSRAAAAERRQRAASDG